MGWTKTATGKWKYLGEEGRPTAAPPKVGWRQRLAEGEAALKASAAEVEVWKASCEALRVRAEAAETARDEARKALELMEAGALMERGAQLVRRAQGCGCGGGQPSAA